MGVVSVTAGPGDQGAAGAAARGYLRASDADRQHVVDDRPDPDARRFHDLDGEEQNGETDNDVFPGQHPILPGHHVHGRHRRGPAHAGVMKAMML